MSSDTFKVEKCGKLNEFRVLESDGLWMRLHCVLLLFPPNHIYFSFAGISWFCNIFYCLFHSVVNYWTSGMSFWPQRRAWSLRDKPGSKSWPLRLGVSCVHYFQSSNLFLLLFLVVCLFGILLGHQEDLKNPISLNSFSGSIWSFALLVIFS